MGLWELIVWLIRVGADGSYNRKAYDGVSMCWRVKAHHHPPVLPTESGSLSRFFHGEDDDAQVEEGGSGKEGEEDQENQSFSFRFGFLQQIEK